MISIDEIKKNKLCHINRKLSYNETKDFFENGFNIIKEKRERKIIQKIASNYITGYSRLADSNEFILSYKNPFYYVYNKLIVASEIGRFIEKAIIRLNKKSLSEIILLQKRLRLRHEPFSKKSTLFEHIIHSICDAWQYSNEVIVVNTNYTDSNLAEIEIFLEMNMELISKSRKERKRLNDKNRKIPTR